MSNDHNILDILHFDNCVAFTREANIYTFVKKLSNECNAMQICYSLS